MRPHPAESHARPCTSSAAAAHTPPAPWLPSSCAAFATAPCACSSARRTQSAPPTRTTRATRPAASATQVGPRKRRVQAPSAPPPPSHARYARQRIGTAALLAATCPGTGRRPRPDPSARWEQPRRRCGSDSAGLAGRLQLTAATRCAPVLPHLAVAAGPAATRGCDVWYDRVCTDALCNEGGTLCTVPTRDRYTGAARRRRT